MCQWFFFIIIVCLSVTSNPSLYSRFWICDIVGYLIFLRRGPCAFFSRSLTLSFSFSGVLIFSQTCRGSHWQANFLTQWVRGRSACRNPHDDHLEAGEPLQSTPYIQSPFCSSIPPQKAGLFALPALQVMTLLGETLGPLQGVSYPLQGVLSWAWWLIGRPHWQELMGAPKAGLHCQSNKTSDSLSSASLAPQCELSRLQVKRLWLKYKKNHSGINVNTRR